MSDHYKGVMKRLEKQLNQPRAEDYSKAAERFGPNQKFRLSKLQDRSDVNCDKVPEHTFEEYLEEWMDSEGFKGDARKRLKLMTRSSFSLRSVEEFFFMNEQSTEAFYGLIACEKVGKERIFAWTLYRANFALVQPTYFLFFWEDGEKAVESLAPEDMALLKVFLRERAKPRSLEQLRGFT